MMFLIDGQDKYESYKKIKLLDYSCYQKETIANFKRILNADLEKLELDAIKSTGYVVDTLEASLWIVLNTESYSSSIIGAINLGGDTDTIGAITGSMTGIIYGYDEIPAKWLNKLKKVNYLLDIADEYEKILKN